ncbi:Ig-like domain-containing protein, partial [Desulfobulbus sp. TB]|nr:Ig-like domain-containing protein [Desulfobulbus sp. TB]
MPVAPPGTGCWCVGVGYIEVIAKVGFDVISHTPAVNEKNRDFRAPELTVSFSDDYDPTTLTDSTFKLEYRNAAGAWQQTTGAFQQSGPKSFKFVPGSDLKDGVKYRATIKSGTNGVKSLAGAEIQSDEQWSFWTVPDLNVTDSFEDVSGKKNVCPPSNDPCSGLEVAVFQTARNAPLVNGKAAVARVYPRWKMHTDVLAADQVQQMDVDFEFTGGGITQNLRATVKRPDLHTAADRTAASNSVNMYHTPTSAADYSVIARPTPQSNATPVEYTASVAPGGTGRTPNITFDYYFLKDGAWAAGVPAATKTAGRALMTAGSAYINDQFPSVSTSYSEKPDYSIGYTTTGTIANNCNPKAGGIVNEVNCPPFSGLVPQKKAEWLCAYEKLSTMLGGRRFVAATVPNGFCPGFTAFAINNKIFMHQDGAGGNVNTIAHEVGHIYGISTANNPNNGHRDNSVGVEGFQIQKVLPGGKGTGINRSYDELNCKDTEPRLKGCRAISLMHSTKKPEKWIHNDDYQTLVGTVRASAALATARMVAQGSGYLIVMGYVDLDQQTGVLAPSFYQEESNDLSVPGATCEATLLDISGNAVESAGFEPGVEIRINGSAMNNLPSQQSGPQFFSTSVPWDDNAAELQISCNGTLYVSAL